MKKLLVLGLAGSLLLAGCVVHDRHYGGYRGDGHYDRDGRYDRDRHDRHDRYDRGRDRGRWNDDDD